MPHAWQPPEPGADDTAPEPHGVQPVEPTPAANEPVAHSRHAVILALGAYWPTGQLMQLA